MRRKSGRRVNRGMMGVCPADERAERCRALMLESRHAPRAAVAPPSHSQSEVEQLESLQSPREVIGSSFSEMRDPG